MQQPETIAAQRSHRNQQRIVIGNHADVDTAAAIGLQLLLQTVGICRKLCRHRFHFSLQAQQFRMGKRIVRFGRTSQLPTQTHRIADAGPARPFRIIASFPHPHRMFGVQFEGIFTTAQLTDTFECAVFRRINLVTVQIYCGKRTRPCPPATDTLPHNMLPHNMLLQQQFMSRQYFQGFRIRVAIRHA